MPEGTREWRKRSATGVADRGLLFLCNESRERLLPQGADVLATHITSSLIIFMWWDTLSPVGADYEVSQNKRGIGRV